MSPKLLFFCPRLLPTEHIFIARQAVSFLTAFRTERQQSPSRPSAFPPPPSLWADCEPQHEIRLRLMSQSNGNHIRDGDPAQNDHTDDAFIGLPLQHFASLIQPRAIHPWTFCEDVRGPQETNPTDFVFRPRELMAYPSVSVVVPVFYWQFENISRLKMSK